MNEESVEAYEQEAAMFSEVRNLNKTLTDHPEMLVTLANACHDALTQTVIALQNENELLKAENKKLKELSEYYTTGIHRGTVE